MRRDLVSRTLAGQEIRECRFNYADMQGTHLEDAQLLSCDMSHAKLIGAIFRLTCKQGSGNKLDDLNACLFLYWFMHMFDVAADIRNHLEAAIGPERLRKVRALFSQELM